MMKKLASENQRSRLNCSRQLLPIAAGVSGAGVFCASSRCMGVPWSFCIGPVTAISVGGSDHDTRFNDAISPLPHLTHRRGWIARFYWRQSAVGDGRGGQLLTLGFITEEIDDRLRGCLVEPQVRHRN